MSEKAIRSRAYPDYFSSKLENYLSLSKPRLLATVVLSALLGFVLPMEPSNTFLQLLFLLFGTALMGAGANTLNQCMEIGPDSRMYRTKNRALPMRKLSEKEAMIFGIVISYLFFTDLPENPEKSIVLWQRIGIGCIGISLMGFFVFIFGRYRMPEVPPAEDNIHD